MDAIRMNIEIDEFLISLIFYRYFYKKVKILMV